MSRNRKSAKAAGARFNRDIADYLAAHVDDVIEVRHTNGAKDRGDVSGLRHLGERIVVEAKNTSRINLAGWANEAEVERGNDDAIAAVIAHKRHGVGDPAEQWITMTARDFVALLTGVRP